MESALAEAYNRGLDLEKAGDREGAAAAYREVLRLDPEDRGGASVRLASLGLGEAPAKAPDAYVAALFDQHAEVFETILVDQLGYCVPMMIPDLLARHGAGPFARLLDLGCGTGLSGDVLCEEADELVGVDISENMIEMAHEKEVYDSLYVAEGERFLAETEEASFDLIVATDVLPYAGALEGLFTGLSAKTVSGGFLAFSTETLADETLAGRDYMVGPRQRFAHAERYIRRLLDENGFDCLEMSPIVVRYDEGEAIDGHLVLARKR
ncbi:methyltransferase domain-containing protein [Stappia albiluteola]|uniref:methyltransferase domain-containing protein n=1 Tax=Stappia albiluteola TaxID=2758565 RepID=UPI002E2A4F80|nr:methyltransferase domain-containing protein [Stappia albiluteola]